MKTIKKKVRISLMAMGILVMSLQPSFGQEVKKLSIDQAIELGLTNSIQLKTNKLNNQVKTIELSQATSNERKYDRMGFSLGTIEGFQLENNVLSKQAELALQEENLKAIYIEEELKTNINRAYYGLLQARENLRINKDTLANIENNHNLIRKKEEIGSSSKSELYLSEIALNEAVINLDNARKAEKEAERSLNMILNLDLDTELKLSSGFEELDFKTDPVKDLEKAYKNRFDMIQINNNYELARLNFDINSSVYAKNTYNYKYNELTLKTIELILNNSRQNVEFDIKSKYDDIESSKKQIQLAKANVEKAREGLRLAELAYKLGSNTYLEVKDAILQLSRTQLALSNAIANYNIKILDYKKAVTIGNVN